MRWPWSSSKPDRQPTSTGWDFCSQCGAPMDWYEWDGGFDTATGEPKHWSRWRCSAFGSGYHDSDSRTWRLTSSVWW